MTEPNPTGPNGTGPNRWHLPAGPSAGGVLVDVTPQSAGWGHSGLRVLELAPGGRHEWQTGDAETVVLPLAGSCDVEADGHTARLAGRANVFAGPSDLAYVPIGSTATVRSAAGGRFAFATARATRRLPFRYLAAAEGRVELRGGGACPRQVNNFGVRGVLDADGLIACGVLTRGGNWSSSPPHKHDEERPGET